MIVCQERGSRHDLLRRSVAKFGRRAPRMDRKPSCLAPLAQSSIKTSACHRPGSPWSPGTKPIRLAGTNPSARRRDRATDFPRGGPVSIADQSHRAASDRSHRAASEQSQYPPADRRSGPRRIEVILAGSEIFLRIRNQARSSSAARDIGAPRVASLRAASSERLLCGGWLGHQFMDRAQNASHCSASPLKRALRWQTASAPSSPQRIPLRFSRSLTTVLHAASMCPDPICQPAVR